MHVLIHRQLQQHRSVPRPLAGACFSPYKEYANGEVLDRAKIVEPPEFSNACLRLSLFIVAVVGIDLLAELHGDLFSRHACPLEGAVFFCGGRRNKRERHKRPHEGTV